MTETSEDERGRRLFQVQRQRAVEDALTRIRSGLGMDWKLFSTTDIEILQRILGETWITTDRKQWEAIAFSRIRVQEIQELIDLGKSLKKEEFVSPITSKEFLKILKRYLGE